MIKENLVFKYVPKNESEYDKLRQRYEKAWLHFKDRDLMKLTPKYENYWCHFEAMGIAILQYEVEQGIDDIG